MNVRAEMQPVQKTALEQKPLIGTEEFAVVSKPDLTSIKRLGEIKNGFTQEMARALSFRLHNNSAVCHDHVFGHKRPLSAYFTLVDGRFVIEWGDIDTSGQAKLHDFLNREIDCMERVKRGGIVRSGHIGWVALPSQHNEVKVALFDSLVSGTKVTPQNPEYPMTTTLLENGILPITSDGYPVEINGKGGERYIT